MELTQTRPCGYTQYSALTVTRPNSNIASYVRNADQRYRVVLSLVVVVYIEAN